MFRSLYPTAVRAVVRAPRCAMSTSTSSALTQQLFNPTEEHAALRAMLREFVEKEVDPQALEFNRKEKFNVDLFRKLGDLGLLGITVETQFGGSGMDAVAACIAHGTYAV
jgi:alkylation response protein AidB-like acyl-CoA dehydrogenase